MKQLEKSNNDEREKINKENICTVRAFIDDIGFEIIAFQAALGGNRHKSHTNSLNSFVLVERTINAQ